MLHRTLCRRKTGDLSLVKGDKREKTLNTLPLSVFSVIPRNDPHRRFGESVMGARRGMSEGQGVQRRRGIHTAYLFEYFPLRLRQYPSVPSLGERGDRG